jgi:hypothetical protein
VNSIAKRCSPPLDFPAQQLAGVSARPTPVA